MKAYLVTTGLLFVALVVAHALRLFVEPHQARNPWFVFTTVISLGMAIWALQLFRSARGSNRAAV